MMSAPTRRISADTRISETPKTDLSEHEEEVDPFEDVLHKLLNLK